MTAKEAMGGHAIKFHVGKTDAELIARAKLLGGPNGSFLSLSEAEGWVRQVLVYRYQVAKIVGSGSLPAARLFMRFGTPTGREAYWNPRYQTLSIRPTFGVFVYINHDPRAPNGFAIHTAYPMNGGIMQKALKSSQEFYEFTKYFMPDYIRFKNDEDFVRSAYQDFMREEPEQLDAFLDFLRQVLKTNPTEKQLFELLSRDSAAHSHGVSGDMTTLFALMLDIGEREAATGRINEIPARPLG